MMMAGCSSGSPLLRPSAAASAPMSGEPYATAASLLARRSPSAADASPPAVLWAIGRSRRRWEAAVPGVHVRSVMSSAPSTTSVLAGASAGVCARTPQPRTDTVARGVRGRRSRGCPRSGAGPTSKLAPGWSVSTCTKQLLSVTSTRLSCCARAAGGVAHGRSLPGGTSADARRCMATRSAGLRRALMSGTLKLVHSAVLCSTRARPPLSSASRTALVPQTRPTSSTVCEDR
mmetsp:Transcript_18515/g.58483  ORF Transcript_18515/g.58483 Transcript_18515/m.58483 type:complete len:232 (+) Transcript_18515:1423-2118(+)